MYQCITTRRRIKMLLRNGKTTGDFNKKVCALWEKGEIAQLKKKIEELNIKAEEQAKEIEALNSTIAYYDSSLAYYSKPMTFVCGSLPNVATMDYEYSNIKTPILKSLIATLPAGRYYIGDLCYALKDTIYHGVFGENGYKSGHYKIVAGEFLVDRTAYGDGSYTGSNDFAYGVDAGIIGIASMSVCNSEEHVYGGTLHTFTEPVECVFRSGLFTFKSASWYLEIDTA